MSVRNTRFDVVAQLASLRRYARSLTRSEVDGDDLVQEALTRALERRNTFRDGAALQPWLLSVLHNVFIDSRRAERNAERRTGLAAQTLPDFQPPSQEHHVRLAQVREAFMDLPVEQRAALHLVAIEGLSFSEAAKKLDIPLGTLMSRLARARAALRAIEGEETSQPRLKIVGGTDDSFR